MAETSESVRVCERVQTAWFGVRAERLGGQVWRDGSLLWTDGPDGTNLMFPSALPVNDVLHGAERARSAGRELAGVWLDSETDATPLASAGFERGWAPWWMTARLDEIALPADPRVHLGVQLEDISDEQKRDGYDQLLDLARVEPDRAFYAAARVDGALAGHVWAFVDGDAVGIFDMDVWPPFRRSGLGAALLHTACGAARDAGARTAVLSTTPQGALIYRAQHFNRVGQGATWWLQLV